VNVLLIQLLSSKERTFTNVTFTDKELNWVKVSECVSFMNSDNIHGCSIVTLPAGVLIGIVLALSLSGIVATLKG
jgi:hypothetical protein